MPVLIVRRAPANYSVPPAFADNPEVVPPVGGVIPLLADEVAIGRNVRDPNNHHPDTAVICLPHDTINRQHARLRRVGNDYAIEDMQSRGGTFVNRVRLGVRLAASTQPATILRDGDIIRISDYELQYRTDTNG